MVSIVISSGHGLYVRGASNYIDEVNEARRVVDRVAVLLAAAGVSVKKFHDNTSTSQSTNLSTIVNYHNAQNRERDVSVHFNAFQATSKAMGTECLYVSQPTLAGEVSAAMAGAGKFINRGAKKRTDLYFLNKTAKPAVLLEVCFVDSSADTNLYKQHFEAICRSIAESVASVKLPAEPGTPEPEPPTEPEAPTEPTPPTEPPVDEISRVEVTTAGNVQVTVNGQLISGDAGPSNPVVPDNQQNIICTVFGGAADPNDSAYPPFGFIDDKVLGVALPYKLKGARPLVKVINAATGQECICEIIDVGPWLIDDNFWDLGTRPLAETCWREGKPLPRGPHKGKVPNGAGIDLTPAAAKAVGISGKGTVDFMLLDAGVS
jgi:N-acetylmuramoyl-L-alanine amidase